MQQTHPIIVNTITPGWFECSSNFRTWKRVDELKFRRENPKRETDRDCAKQKCDFRDGEKTKKAAATANTQDDIEM
jgi:hypothetical protein